MTSPFPFSTPLAVLLVSTALQAQPHLRVGSRSVESGRTLTLYADYPGKEVVPLRWSIEGAPGGGAFTQVRTGKENLFRAAPVTEPRLVTIRVTAPDGQFHELAIQVTPPRLAITCRDVPGKVPRYHLEATVGGHPERCLWTVEEPDGGVFLRPGGGGAGMDFLPSEGLGASVRHVIAYAKGTPGLSGAYAMAVRTPGGLLARLAPGVEGLVRAFAQRAQMTAFADLSADHTAEGWQAMVRVERFGPDFPAGGWLVAGPEGLGLVSPAKTFTRIPLPEGFQGTPFGLAFQPAAPGDPGQPVVILAAHEPVPDRHFGKVTLYRLHAGGGLEPMRTAPLEQVTAMAMNRHGDLFLATPSTLSRVGPGGELIHVAGSYRWPYYLPAEEAVDGHGSAAVFTQLRGLTLDPATDELYASDAGCIRRISPAGEVTTILGTPAGVMNLDRTFEKILPGGVPIPPGQACLAQPAALQVQNGVVFIVDRGRGAILAFNTASRRLFQLVDRGNRSLVRRYGPLRTFYPDLLASETAVLACDDGPLVLAGEGAALYVDGSSVVQLDFPAGAFGASAPPPGPAAPPPGPAAPPPGPAAPPARD